MNTLFKLAWRNIWRSKRRTLITAASIFFAVFFAAFMRSIQVGAWDHMLNNVVNFYFGYAQIHQNGFWDEQSIDKAFPLADHLKDLESEVDQIASIVPRLESFALASTGKNTVGVMVVGIEPKVENEMTKLQSRLTQGTFFEASDKSVLIAEGAAEKLGLGLGDTIVLISQGYHGSNAAGKYPVEGILNFGSPDLNKRMIYLPLKEAQWFYGAEEQVTSLALKINDRNDTQVAVNAVRQKLDMEAYEVMDWQEMIPELVEAREVDAAGNQLVLIVLYLIIAFGVFGTILMMTKEREYEFGVLLSIGMKRWQLSTIVWLETLFIGVIGVAAGILASMPLVYYFKRNPIDLSVMGEEAVQTYEKFGMEPVLPAAFETGIFLEQGWIILLITTVLAVYPWLKIGKLAPVQAMRS